MTPLDPPFTEAPPSDAAPLLPLWIANLYREAGSGFRSKLIECLTRPVGVLGLVAVADGVFAAVRQRHGWQAQVSVDDTISVSADHVYQLASYVQEAVPEVLYRLSALLAQHPQVTSATVSGVLLWETLRRWRQPRGQ